MLFKMSGLIDRNGIFWYRRRVPDRLQTLLGITEVRRWLRTSDKAVAQRLWSRVHAEVNQMFAEAEKGIASPAVAAYKAVRSHVPHPNEEREEALDYHLTSMLEENHLSPAERVVIEGLLRRRDEQAAGDNPPLSLVFERYFTDKKTTGKTRLEWERVLGSFTKAVAADLPVRSITPAHIREWKKSLQATPSSRTEGAMLSPATIQKLLNALKAVLSWARNEDYISTNPTERITVQKPDHNDATGRLPYDADDLSKLFSKDALEMRRER